MGGLTFPRPVRPMTAPRQHPVEVSLPGYGVFVLESQHAPHFHMPAERHTFLEVFLVIRGAGVFELGGVEHPCADGDVVAVPPGTPHQIADRPGEPLGLYGICVAPDVWRHDPELVRRLPAGRLPVRPVVADRVRTDLRRVLFEQTRTARASGTVILGLTLQLLAALVRASEADPPAPSTSREHRQAVERYLAELPDRFFEPTSLDQVAGELGMSRRRFTELFRELAGESWADRLARLRVRHACRLLADTPRSIAAIAFEAGYEDLSGFYRAFKRSLGVPPDAYRKRSAAAPVAAHNGRE
jgi:AraC-like DNA-binding protein/quercetin dioxygenase-like cupin family protein